MANSHASLVANVDCDYNFLELGHLINIKPCSVKNEILIQRENTQLSIRNPYNAYEYQSSPFCEAFVAENKSIYYFPEYLGIYPKNLKAIVIKQSKLRKITAPNLAGFCNLEYLDLSFNQLLVLKPNLFASNPNLTKIWLNNNKIYHIDSTTFNGLKQLNGLSLTENVCYTASANNLHDALAISKHSLCSDELLFLCGAFSQAIDALGYKIPPELQNMSQSLNLLQTMIQNFKNLTIQRLSFENDATSNTTNILLGIFDSSVNIGLILCITLLLIIIILLIINIIAFVNLKRLLTAGKIYESVKVKSRIYDYSNNEQDHYQKRNIQDNNAEHILNEQLGDHYQKYEEIPENTNNQNQFQYGEATADNTEDFYSEQQDVDDDTYAVVNNKNPNDVYAEL